MITDDLKPANLVLEVIARNAEREIAYGEKHIHRGTLDYHGQSYRRIAEIALHELHENDRFDHEELQERLEQIDAAVASAG